jgi:hypothetical protein
MPRSLLPSRCYRRPQLRGYCPFRYSWAPHTGQAVSVSSRSGRPPTHVRAQLIRIAHARICPVHPQLRHGCPLSGGALYKIPSAHPVYTAPRRSCPPARKSTCGVAGGSDGIHCPAQPPSASADQALLLPGLATVACLSSTARPHARCLRAHAHAGRTQKTHTKHRWRGAQAPRHLPSTEQAPGMEEDRAAHSCARRRGGARRPTRRRIGRPSPPVRRSSTQALAGCSTPLRSLVDASCPPPRLRPR